MIKYLSKVLLITGKYKKYLPFIFILSFLSMGLELLGLSLIIPFITILKSPELFYQHDLWLKIAGLLDLEEGPTALIFMSSVLFGVYVLKTILNILVQRSIINFSYNLMAYLRIKFSELYLSAPYLFHTKRRSNEIINILQSHVSQFSKAIVGALLQVTAELITLVAILIFLVMAYPIPSITAFVVLGAFAISYDVIVGRQLKSAGQDVIDTSNHLIKAVRHGVQSLKEVRVLGKGEYFHSDLSQTAIRASKMHAFVSILQMTPRYVLELLIVGIVIISSIMMLWTGNNGEKVMEGLAVFAVAVVRLLPSATRIISNIGNLRYAQKYLDGLYEDYQELHATKQTLKASNASKIKYESASLENIEFTYPGSEVKILNDVSLSFNKGEIIGICGPSGSGKSTLVDIILGLLSPDKGLLKINDELHSKTQWAKHNLASYISQKPIMLDDTLRRNVAIGIEGKYIEDKKIVSALQKAQLTELLESLDEGLDTVIGEDGVLFSGGQRQRIALARSFYFGRDIIVFDEATSALDKDTENEVLKAIQSLKGKATVLFISHNDQPFQICDRICYLNDGKLTEK